MPSFAFTPALLGLAEQPLGPEQDHDQEKHERHAFLVGRRDVGAHQVLEHADQHAAEERAARLVEAADDRGIERLQADDVAHVELREVGRRNKQRRHRGEQRVDEEDVEDHALHVDAEHGGGLGVLRHRLHRAAGERAIQKPLQRDNDRASEHESADVVNRDAKPGDVDQRVRKHVGKRVRLRAVSRLHQILHADREAERRDHQRDHAVAAQRIDDERLEARAEEQHRRRARQDERRPERQPSREA
jgi:hypothetical protein